jgi:hypothetical protein
MTSKPPTFPPLDVDDLDARLDRRAAARGIPALKSVEPVPVPEEDDDEGDDEPAFGLALVETGLAAIAGPGDNVGHAGHTGIRRRRVPRPIRIKPTPPVSTPDAPTPRSRMKSLNVELPDYVWVELKSRAAREMVSVRHVIMTLLNDAGIAITPVDLIEDGRRLR